MKKRKPKWRADLPIYRQIVEIVIERLIRGKYAEGDLLPSVRQLSDEHDVSTLTAAKVHQELSGLGVFEKRRGIGLEVKAGARARLLENERRRFWNEQWPLLEQRLELLDIDVAQLQRRRSDDQS
ncbi:MAG: GntR family transcriptional regulator [Myxococcota bacterium]